MCEQKKERGVEPCNDDKQQKKRRRARKEGKDTRGRRGVCPRADESRLRPADSRDRIINHFLIRTQPFAAPQPPRPSCIRSYCVLVLYCFSERPIYHHMSLHGSFRTVTYCAPTLVLFSHFPNLIHPSHTRTYCIPPSAFCSLLSY